MRGFLTCCSGEDSEICCVSLTDSEMLLGCVDKALRYCCLVQDSEVFRSFLRCCFIVLRRILSCHCVERVFELVLCCVEMDSEVLLCVEKDSEVMFYEKNCELLLVS